MPLFLQTTFFKIRSQLCPYRRPFSQQTLNIPENLFYLPQLIGVGKTYRFITFQDH